MNKFNFSYLQPFIITIIAVFFTLGCSDNDNTLSTNNLSQKIEVEKIPFTRSSGILETNLYNIRYKNIFLQNVRLSEEDLKKIKSSNGFEPSFLNLYGYSSFEDRYDRNKGWYTRSFNSKDPTAVQCGIPAGIYIAKDVNIVQTYDFPSDLVIILDNNSSYPDYLHMGWLPENLKQPGYKYDLSKAHLKLTTSAYYIKYNSGQRLFLTYPVKTDNLMWQIKYIKLF